MGAVILGGCAPPGQDTPPEPPGAEAQSATTEPATDTAAARPVLQEGRLDTAYRPGASPRWFLALPEGARATVIALHGFGGAADYWFDPPLAQDLARQHGVAIAAVDGGDTYWHRRADGSDSGAMVLEDLLPVLEQSGAPVDRVGLTGFSMGGYGALLLATELPPEQVLGVASVSAAIFLSAEAAGQAFDDPDDYAAHDLFDRVDALRALPVWLACGEDDSFAPANRRLAEELPDASTVFDEGRHDRAYVESHWPDAIAFLAGQLG